MTAFLMMCENGCRMTCESSTQTQFLEELACRVGRSRLRAASVPRMKPSEVCRQARDTASVIDELLARMEHLHPDLDCLVNDTLYRARGEFGSNLSDRIKPYLYRLCTGLLPAVSAMERRPVRIGPKTNWSTVRDAITTSLCGHSNPPVSDKGSEALAGELLKLCGLRPRVEKLFASQVDQITSRLRLNKNSNCVHFKAKSTHKWHQGQ
jgi:hypothetical protein